MLLLVTAAILWIVPSDDYLFLPDTAQPVAPLVHSQGREGPDRPAAASTSTR